MDLVKIDDIGFQPPQTGFTFPTNRVRLERGPDVALRIPNPLAFGEDVWAWRPALEGVRDYLFGMAQTIEGSGVNPVHTVVQHGVNGGGRFGLVLRPHAAVPSTTSDGPGPYSDRSDFQIAISQFSFQDFTRT